MAAVLEPKDAAAKNNSQVDEQIAQATSRIRAHDLAFGGLILAAIVLIYATAMITLDKYLNLPEWLRQLALAGLVAVLAGAAYLTLLSPLRKRINPLYAAKQVEGTIDDPKNSVTGYVDAREKGDLNATVKAALASKAAKAAAEADVNKAVDHRGLAYVGGVAAVFLLALVVLFFVFRPTQFASLAGRAFVPFSSKAIATRTQLTLVKPETPELTITTGQSVTVAVYVGGKVPNPDGPEKVRLLVRHNPADPNYDEIPMVQGATSREWEIRVPDYLVQNGFWYKVAAGDATTEEYHVTVRSLPRFSTFRVTYEYPKYLRRKTETSDGAVIKAYRGTNVTLVARANRAVQNGFMVLEPSNKRVEGTTDPADPNALKFVFELTEAGKYKLTFNATNGERPAEPFESKILVDPDAAPLLVINKPEADETTEPANGIVKIEGKVGDDFGVDTVTLKMRIVSPVERPLKDQPYLNGKSPSFRREKDDTWPTDVDYKGSIDLGTLTKDAADLPLELRPDMVIEYWLEAADNCTKPNVGVSNKKHMRLAPPKTDETEMQNLDEQKQNRKDEEKKFNDDQKQKLDQEKREQRGGQQGEKNEKKDGDPMGGTGEPQKKDGDAGNMPKSEDPPKKPNDPMMGTPDMGMMGDPMGPKGDPKTDPNAKPDPKNAKGDAKPDPKVDATAQDLKNELDKENQDGGSAKRNNAPQEKDRTDPANPKPQPKGDMGMMGMPDGMGNASEPKPEPKQPMDPMGKPDAAPSATKPQGDLQQPPDPSAPKPEQKQPEKGGKRPPAPSETRGEPAGSSPGDEKPQPKDQQPQPKDPNAQQDPNSGAIGKPDTQKKDDPNAPKPGTQRPDPAADAGSKPKPMPETNRGTEKPSQPQPKEPAPKNPPDPMGPKTPDPKPADPDAGDAKPQTAPPAAGTKPMPKEGPMPMGKDADPKPAGGANAAEPRPEEPKKDPAKGTKPVDKGTDKPPANDKGDNKGSTTDTAPPPKQKLDEKQMKELQQAANDLTSPDKNKQQEARDKLDKAIGPENRKEVEKLANDLKSPDEKTRKDAEQKVKDAIERQKKDPEKKDPDGKGATDPKKDDPKKGPGATDTKNKEIEQAVNDLQSPDPNKQQAARDKLDKLVGPEKRKEIEQAVKDLKATDDKAKQEAAQKKIDDLKKEMDKQAKKDDKGDPKGKEPTKEELDDAMKKAQDLQSKDPAKRKQAQKELDDQLGEEKRKQLEEMLKNEDLKDPQSADKVRNQLKEWMQGPAPGPLAKDRMEDKKKKLAEAELMLEQFENEENRKLLQAKKGWTDEEYKKFLKEYEDYVKNLRADLAKERLAPAPKEKIDTTINASSGGKVEGSAGTGAAGVGGPTVAPPGFEDAKRRFEEALKEAMKKKP